MDVDAQVAVRRFGLGPRPGERATAEADPRGWLRLQLTARDPQVGPQPGLIDSPALVAELRARRGVERTAAQKMADNAANRVRLKAELDTYAKALATTDLPFRERWVAFWADLLCISTNKGTVIPFAGPYVREAIRPNALGKFSDLLLGMVHHPAMLLYLDQARSVGPSSKSGLKSENGLNENLARELLELHTVGVDAGYTQDDVIALAKALTGTTLPVKEKFDDTGSAWVFEDRMHEPGSKTILGTRYPEQGADEVPAILADLARHPSTAKRLARRIAVAFVSDDPPAKLVEKLEQTWIETDGLLMAVAGALVDSDHAWKADAQKLRSPLELVIAAARAISWSEDGAPLVSATKTLGQTLWQPPSPQGWPLDAASWAGPEAIVRRVEWAEKAGKKKAAAVADPLAVARDVFGSDLTDRTRDAIAGASSPKMALGLLFVCREMQWR